MRQEHGSVSLCGCGVSSDNWFCWNHLNFPDVPSHRQMMKLNWWAMLVLLGLGCHQCLECPQAVDQINDMMVVLLQVLFFLPRLRNICFKQIEGHEIHFQNIHDERRERRRFLAASAASPGERSCKQP